MPEAIDILPDGDDAMTDVFTSIEEYEAYIAEFYEKVRPELEQLAEARRQSMEDSMRRWYR